VKKFLNKNNDEEMVKYCKKCLCELASINKSKYCAHCKKEKGTSLRNNGLRIAGVVVTLVLGSKMKGGGPNNS